MGQFSIGQVVDGYAFQGGDYKDKNNWVDVEDPVPGANIDGFAFKGGSRKDKNNWQPFDEFQKDQNKKAKELEKEKQNPLLPPSAMAQEFPQPTPSQHMLLGSGKSIEELHEDQAAFDKVEEINYQTYRKFNPTMSTEFLEGLLTPAAELIIGATEVAGKETGIPLGKEGEFVSQELTGRTKVPFKYLDPSEKAAHIAGQALSYAGGGALLNMGIKGLAKLGLKSIGKEVAYKQAKKGLQKHLGNAVSKNVKSDTLKFIVGKSAGQVIKNGPALAAEGFAWSALAGRGDLEEGLKGGVLSALVPFGVTMVKGGFGKAGKSLTGAVKKDVTAAGEKLKIIPKPVKNLATPKAMERFRQEAFFYKKKGYDVDDYLLNTKNETSATSSTWEMNKRLTFSQSIATQDAQKAVAAIQANQVAEGATKEFTKLDNHYTKLLTQRRDMIKKIAEKNKLEFEEVLPKSYQELSISNNAKAKLYQSEFPTLKSFGDYLDEQMSMVGDDFPRKDFAIDVLTNHLDIHPRTANKMYNQMTYAQSIVRKKTLSESTRINLKTNALKRMNNEISKAELKWGKAATREVQAKRNPMYDPEYGTKIKAKTPGEEIKRLTNGYFRANAERLGVRVDKDFKIPTNFFDQFQIRSSFYNKIERSTGLPMSQVVNDIAQGNLVKAQLATSVKQYNWEDAAKKLQDMGVDGKKTWELMHYVKKVDGVNKFVPDAVEGKGMHLPAYKGEQPSQEVLNHLFKFRDLSDHLHKIMGEKGVEIGNIPNYVAIKRRIAVGKGGVGKFKKRSAEKSRESLTFERTWGMVPKDLKPMFETDYFKLLPRTINDSLNVAAFDDVTAKANNIDFMLRNFGMSGAADDFDKYYQKAMGNRSSIDRKEAMLEDFIVGSKDWAKEISRTVAANERAGNDLHQAVLKEMVELMYGTYIGTLNPHILVKQFFQPDLVGGAMVGLKNVQVGKALAYTTGVDRDGIISKVMGKVSEKVPVGAVKQAKKDLERVWDELIPERLDVAEMGEQQMRALTGIGKILGWPGKPGMWAFTELDKFNRKSMFLSGLRQFRNAVKDRKVGEILDHHLNEADKARIVEALDTKGVEAAADAYGLLVAKNSNFAYDMAEKASFFGEGAGKWIRFTIWSSNSFDLHRQMVQKAVGGKPMYLAKAIAYQTAGIYFAQRLINENFYPVPIPGTDTQVSSGMPVSAILPFVGGDFELFPAIKAAVSGETPMSKVAKKMGLLTEKKGRKRKKRRRQQKPNFSPIQKAQRKRITISVPVEKKRR